MEQQGTAGTSALVRPVRLGLFGLAVVGALAGLFVLRMHVTSDPLADVHAYYDAGTVGIYKGLDLIAADIYPDKFGFEWSLVTQLGDACTAAQLSFTSVIAIASDTTPIPSVAQVDTWNETAQAAGSEGFAVYSWGLGAEQAQYVQAVQELA